MCNIQESDSCHWCGSFLYWVTTLMNVGVKFGHKKAAPKFLKRLFCMAIESIEELHSFFFDSCFFTGKGTQIIQLSAAYFTDFVHCNVFDER